MSQPDIVSVRSVDFQNTEGTAAYFIDPGSPSTQVDDLVTLLSAFQAAAPDQGLQTIERFVDTTPSPVAAVDGLVSIAAALDFTCADTTDYVVYVLGPVDGTFTGGGVVDDTQVWVSNLTAWLQANGTNEAGSALTTYNGGVRVELQPGFLDINGAASYARSNGMVAEFYAQDGADVKVG